MKTIEDISKQVDKIQEKVHEIYNAIVDDPLTGKKGITTRLSELERRSEKTEIKINAHIKKHLSLFSLIAGGSMSTGIIISPAIKTMMLTAIKFIAATLSFFAGLIAPLIIFYSLHS